MKVPFLDLKRLHESMQGELTEALATVIGESRFVGSSSCLEFEELFAALHCGSAAGCASGTDALALALRALGIGPGDEVIVPSMTFIATAEAVVHVGATPVIADVSPDTLLLTSETVDSVRTPRTQAVIPVHLYGHVVPFSELEAWRSIGLLVVEDAAQAHLARWNDQPIGTASDAACFSFYPGKTLGALGDGGLVLTPDESVVAEIKRLRDHGRATKYEHDTIGWCSRLDGLQAAFLTAKLGHLPRWTQARQQLASRYAEVLDPIAGVHLVPWEEGAVHHILAIRVDEADRDRIREALALREIGTGIHYPVPLSEQAAMSPWARPTPVSEAAGRELISLPMDPLMTLEMVDAVALALSEVVA